MSALSSFLLFLGLFLALVLIFAFTCSVWVLCALAAQILFLLVSGILALCQRNKTELRVALPPTATKGGSATGHVQRKCESRFPTGPVGLRLRLTNRLTGETTRLNLRDTDSFSFACTHCGEVEILVERAWLRGLVGFLPLAIPTTAHSRMTVLPDTFQPEVRLTIPLAMTLDSEDYAPNRRGSDPTEAYQYREYLPGDSLHSIHWKLSAKQDNLMVREASLPVSRSLLVFWEKRGNDLDAQAEVYFSLCQALCQQGYAFTMGFGREGGVTFLEITSIDDLLPAIPAVLRGAPAAEDPLPHYTAEKGQAGFGRILYFGSQVSPALPQFVGTADTTLLLCGAEGPEAYPTVTYTAENYPEALRHLEL